MLIVLWDLVYGNIKVYDIVQIPLVDHKTSTPQNIKQNTFLLCNGEIGLKLLGNKGLLHLVELNVDLDYSSQSVGNKRLYTILIKIAWIHLDFETRPGGHKFLFALGY